MIRQTTKQDLPAVMEIIRGAQKSLAALGISQWQDGYPREEDIVRDMENGISYVLVDDGVLAAAAAISFAPDPTYATIYDGAWLSDSGRYGVIHRIAVKGDAKRKGYATELLSFAAELARKQGISFLRVDTHEGNLPMRKFLEKQGFVQCGMSYLAGGQTKENERVAYEKKLEEISPCEK